MNRRNISHFLDILAIIHDSAPVILFIPNRLQLYYINSDNEENNFTIEFSSNYDNIELDLNNITKIGEDADKGYGGFQKYYVNINFSEHNENSFIVKLKENKLLNDNNENNENNNNPLETANYILRYYIIDEEQDFKDKFNFIGTKKVENNKLQIHIEIPTPLHDA